MNRQRQTGFTLIEVVIAFAAFALCVGALFEVFGGAVRRSAQSRDREQAWLTAQSVLSELRVARVPWQAEQSGRTAVGMSWRINVSPYDSAQNEQGAWQAFRVTVRVRPERAGAREVVLESIELARNTL